LARFDKVLELPAELDDVAVGDLERHRRRAHLEPHFPVLETKHDARAFPWLSIGVC
jgi:hypothetical protein